jgi:hypothetical protein
VLIEFILKEAAAMLFKKSNIVESIVVCLFFFLLILKSLFAADTTSQIISQMDEILQAKPLRKSDPKGDKKQAPRLVPFRGVSYG